MLTRTSDRIATRRIARQRALRRHLPAILQSLEPRVLFTAAHSAADISGVLALIGVGKIGTLAFDGVSAVTAGNWTDQSGIQTLVDPGSASTYAIAANGATTLSLATNASGSAIISNLALSGFLNATNDVVALNETDVATPLANGFDLLVNHAAVYTTSNFTGTWNISALDFRGSVTIDHGLVTGGLLYRESGQQSAAVTGGTASLNSDGTGTLNLTTNFTGSLGTVALSVTMNIAKDSVVGNATSFGNGTANSELAVLTKSSGTYASSDIVGKIWTLNSAAGSGSLSFLTANALAGTLTDVNGLVWTISGNYTLGGNGTLIANLKLKNGAQSRRESLYGAVNQSKNLIALDRAIANGESGPNLTVLINAANHAPTERATAVLPQSAFQAVAVAIDYPTLLTATSAADLDHDTLSFLITNVPAVNGTLSITHEGSTSAVIAGQTIMVNGDTLTWVPSQTQQGQLNAFTVKANDGTAFAVTPSKVYIATSALPVVNIVAKKGNALEALAGQAAGNGTFQLQRAGGDKTLPLTVTLDIAGTAVDGTNYTLLGPDNATLSTLTTVTFPANVATITLTVASREDGVADGTLSVRANVLPDPNSSASSYLPSIHHSAQVNVQDSDPTVLVVPVVRQVREGNSNTVAFFVERLPAQGGNVNGSFTVNLDYSNSTFDVSHLIAPASVSFNPGEVKKRVIISTTDDGLADPTQTIVASLVPGAFNPAAGEASASINVLDNAPSVRVVTNIPSALEVDPTNKFGEFTVIRSGSTGNSLVVDLSAVDDNGFGKLGTNYLLEDASGNTLTSAITIPTGASSALVKVVPIDDATNDPVLKASVTLTADAGPTYHIAAGNTPVVKILNNDRPPIITNGFANLSIAQNASLQIPFATLVTDTGAALAAGETNGTLQIKVGNVVAGHLKILRSGAGSAVAIGHGALINPGDVLIWVPPLGVTAANLPAFTLKAHDGTLDSSSFSTIEVTVT